MAGVSGLVDKWTANEVTLKPQLSIGMFVKVAFTSPRSLDTSINYQNFKNIR